MAIVWIHELVNVGLYTSLYVMYKIKRSYTPQKPQMEGFDPKNIYCYAPEPSSKMANQQCC